MWERTITVGSAGKLFAATGRRVGWLIGPPALIDPALAVSTRIVSCVNTPMREGAPAALEQARERRFFETQLEEYAERRAVLVDAFKKLGMEYAWTEGSYFELLNISRVRWPEEHEFPESLNGRAKDSQRSSHGHNRVLIVPTKPHGSSRTTLASLASP